MNPTDTYHTSDMQVVWNIPIFNYSKKCYSVSLALPFIYIKIAQF